MKTHIRFLSTPSGELIEELCGNHELKELRFLLVCRDEMAQGRSFRESWRLALESKDGHRMLSNEEMKLLISFGESFGTTDTAGQLSLCELYIERLGKCIERAKDIKGRYGSVSVGMGIVCGFGLVIILI